RVGIGREVVQDAAGPRVDAYALAATHEPERALAVRDAHARAADAKAASDAAGSSVDAEHLDAEVAGFSHPDETAAGAEPVSRSPGQLHDLRHPAGRQVHADEAVCLSEREPRRRAGERDVGRGAPD